VFFTGGGIIRFKFINLILLIKMKKWIWVVVIIVVLVLVAGLAKAPKDTSTIKIGSLLSLTGDASAWGENAQRGIAIAVDEVNQKGGVNGRRVEIIYEDTASNPKTAVSAFQKITSLDDVDAIIGPLLQAEVASVVSLIDKNDIPVVAPSFISIQNRINSYNPIFVWMDPEVEAGRLADYVYNQGIRRVGVIGTLDAWEDTVTMGFANRFKALGGIITDIEQVQPTADDMKLPIAKILASKPEAIYLGTYYQFINSLKEINNLGYKGELYSIEVDDYLVGETSRWSNGLQFISPDYYDISFIKMFEDKYGIKPGIPAGQAYDSAKILFSLIKEDNKDTLEAMKNFSKYNGVSGELTITQDGKTYMQTALFQINKGQVFRIEALK
jgi:branched-chain amino acid transport system substrate-binding protein